MSARVRQAIKRLEKELELQNTRTMSTQFALFLDDLAVLIAYVKRGDKRV